MIETDISPIRRLVEYLITIFFWLLILCFILFFINSILLHFYNTLFFTISWIPSLEICWIITLEGSQLAIIIFLFFFLWTQLFRFFFSKQKKEKIKDVTVEQIGKFFQLETKIVFSRMKLAYLKIKPTEVYDSQKLTELRKKYSKKQELK